MDATASVLFGKTRQAVLGALFQDPEQGWYLRQLERETGLSTGTLHLELKQLIKADLIRKRQDGNRIVYQPNPTHPIYEPLREIVEKTCGIPARIGQGLAELGDGIRYAAIFGSMARGRDSAASDIDLIVVGKLSNKDLIPTIQQLEQNLSREIGFRLYSPEEFLQRRETDPFLQRVLSQPLTPVMGKLDDAG
jgi:predicted nucleotidyltransferase/DNA-binding HxlR family transcriptional regulator